MVTRLWLDNSKTRVSSRRAEKESRERQEKTHLSDAASTIGSAAAFTSVPAIIASAPALLFLLVVSSSFPCEDRGSGLPSALSQRRPELCPWPLGQDWIGETDERITYRTQRTKRQAIS